MSVKRIIQTWTAAVLVAGAPAVFAAETDKEASEVKELIRADTVKGSSLWDFHGNQIGTVDHVLLQPSGNMAFAVINADKFLEKDSKVAVPWSKIYVKRKSDASGAVVFTLDTTKEFLKGAPAFDPESVDDLADPVKAGPIYRYWKVEMDSDRSRLDETARERAIDRARERATQENPRRAEEPERAEDPES